MFAAEGLSVRYDDKDVVSDYSFRAAQGEVLSIIGPNGSGKSTVLKAVSRMIPYYSGKVTLSGVNLKSMNTKEIACQLCMLCQKNAAPNDMTVKELVSYGRYPHKKWYERLNQEDQDIVHWALEKTHLLELNERRIADLSGGESQRAWIAMALAQRPRLLLLDEPTTYLDISHQHEVLELVRELNREMGMTVIMVLHDLNQAACYSDRIIVMKNGKQVQSGSPDQVMTKDMIRDVYRMESEIQQVAWDASPRIHLLSTVKPLTAEAR